MSETEISGKEPNLEFTAFMERALANPETRAAYDEVMARDAALKALDRVAGGSEPSDTARTERERLAAERDLRRIRLEARNE